MYHRTPSLEVISSPHIQHGFYVYKCRRLSFSELYYIALDVVPCNANDLMHFYGLGGPLYVLDEGPEVDFRTVHPVDGPLPLHVISNGLVELFGTL